MEAALILVIITLGVSIVLMIVAMFITLSAPAPKGKRHKWTKEEIEFRGRFNKWSMPGIMESKLIVKGEDSTEARLLRARSRDMERKISDGELEEMVVRFNQY